MDERADGGIGFAPLSRLGRGFGGEGKRLSQEGSTLPLERTVPLTPGFSPPRGEGRRILRLLLPLRPRDDEQRDDPDADRDENNAFLSHDAARPELDEARPIVTRKEGVRLGRRQRGAPNEERHGNRHGAQNAGELCCGHGVRRGVKKPTLGARPHSQSLASVTRLSANRSACRCRECRPWRHRHRRPCECPAPPRRPRRPPRRPPSR